MSTPCPLHDSASGFELRFDAIVVPHASFSFPCSATGQVDLDLLDDGARRDYLFAHTLIGRDFAMPVVRACTA